MPFEEAKRAAIEARQAAYYREWLEESRNFRATYKQRKGIVRAEEMPWEDSPHGRIKHVVNEKMNTREMCMDVYIQVIPPGSRSGKHRHMWEEIFYVLEGRGYDLHWDVQFECQERYHWSWSPEAKRFDWEEGDIVYIPPYTIHQHFNGDPERPARIISASNRIVKAIGYNWLEQLENAPEYPSGR